jgi:glycosyltransferase involved in cell wall biosynthesis
LRISNVPGEVLVIDDGSRDGSPILLRQLEAMYYRNGLRVLSLADHGGFASCRNLALLNAGYRYVALLDANKELIPENLPSFLRALQDTEAAVVYGNVLVRTPASRCAMNLLSNESVQFKLFQGNYIDAFSLVDRCQLLDHGGYETSYQVLEDHEIWLHLAVNGRKIVFVPLAFGYHYVLPGSLTTKAGEKGTETVARTERTYDPFQARAHLPLNTNLLRFHPALGYF